MWLTRENILNLVGQEDLYRFYWPSLFQIGGAVSKPYEKDDHPSFSWFETNEEDILWKDFTSGKSGGFFELFLICFPEYSEKTMLIKVATDFNLNLQPKPTSFKDAKNIVNLPDIQQKTVISEKVEHIVEIRVIIEPFQQNDIYYWDIHGISEETLIKYNVFRCKQAWILNTKYSDNWRVFHTYRDKDPMYVYIENDTELQIYRPYAKKKSDKFRSSLKRETIQGFTQLPEKADVLFIAKSRKDIMNLYDCTDYYAIAPSSEHSYFSIINRIEELKERFKHIVIWFDNDEPGVSASINLQKLVGCNYVNIPKGYPKDNSDYTKEYGKDTFINFFKQSVIPKIFKF